MFNAAYASSNLPILSHGTVCDGKHDAFAGMSTVATVPALIQLDGIVMIVGNRLPGY